jgi:uncharacterized cupin superfamily protein
MQSTTAAYAIDRVDGGDYEPFVVEGAQVGEIRWLRASDHQGPPDALEVGVWRSDPATYDYFFATDETFHVVEGAVTIELPDTGESLELHAGDIAYFREGIRSVWTITAPFEKFVITPRQAGSASST